MKIKTMRVLTVNILGDCLQYLILILSELTQKNFTSITCSIPPDDLWGIDINQLT